MHYLKISYETKNQRKVNIKFVRLSNKLNVF